MFDNIYTKNLQELGLTEKEATVYLALLGKPETGTSILLRTTGLHGQYVYAALARLEELGLVQHAIKRGRKKFSAKHPKALARLIDYKKHIADDLAEKLTAVATLPAEQRFEVFQGEQSYITHEFDLLREAKEGSMLQIIGGLGDQFATTMGDNLEAYETLRIKKGIAVQYLGCTEQQDALAVSSHKRTLFDFRLLPGLFTGIVNTNIWSNAIGLNIYGNPVTNFTLWNQPVAESYRQFFVTLWNLVKK